MYCIFPRQKRFTVVYCILFSLVLLFITCPFEELYNRYVDDCSEIVMIYLMITNCLLFFFNNFCT